MSRLILEVDPAANFDTDPDPASELHIYESSLVHTETSERLLSIATHGPGMRLTKSQALEFHGWLTEWLAL